MLLSPSMTGKFVVSYGRLPVDLLYTYISSCLLGTLFLLSLVRIQCCNSPTRVNNFQILPQFLCVLNEFPTMAPTLSTSLYWSCFDNLGIWAPSIVSSCWNVPQFSGRHRASLGWLLQLKINSTQLALKSNLDHRHCRLDYHEFMELYIYVAPLECTWLKLENHNWIYFSSDKEHDKGLVQIMVTG
jgi:hypothetical protein